MWLTLPIASIVSARLRPAGFGCCVAALPEVADCVPFASVGWESIRRYRPSSDRAAETNGAVSLDADLYRPRCGGIFCRGIFDDNDLFSTCKHVLAKPATPGKLRGDLLSIVCRHSERRQNGRQFISRAGRDDPPYVTLAKRLGNCRDIERRSQLTRNRLPSRILRRGIGACIVGQRRSGSSEQDHGGKRGSCGPGWQLRRSRDGHCLCDGRGGATGGVTWSSRAVTCVNVRMPNPRSFNCSMRAWLLPGLTEGRTRAETILALGFWVGGISRRTPEENRRSGKMYVEAERRIERTGHQYCGAGRQQRNRREPTNIDGPPRQESFTGRSDFQRRMAAEHSAETRCVLSPSERLTRPT